MNNDIKVSGLSVLLLRIALSGIFISAGITHLTHPDKIAGRIDNAAYSEFAYFFGDPFILGILTGYVLLIAGIMFLLGILTRWSALILFIVLIPISITIQMGNGLIHGPFWKNIALFGGLLFFILNNPKAYNLYNKTIKF
ncbi:DoxX family protein [Weeksellaceae bacterium KMM 9724]|uniref:DoxX family protein n=1 Tax=Profundicola chukchiensis TaxID=2961959 RepID=UPI0024407890|nr:DoxX family protein [Profundicola chukchiensis]MDG4951439.1 DoxX family protein [Profundicola chukchiensis]